MDKPQFVSGKLASEILGVHQRTLHLWDKKNKIDVMRAPGGKRFYNVDKYLKAQGLNTDKKNVMCDTSNAVHDNMDCSATSIQSTLIFTPVGKDKTNNEKPRRKILYMVNKKSMSQNLRQNYENYTPVGTHLKNDEKNLFKIIDWAIDGEIGELVIENKNIIPNFNLVQHIINKYSNGKIIVLDDFLMINDFDIESN